jgi:hypothetical protein
MVFKVVCGGCTRGVFQGTRNAGNLLLFLPALKCIKTLFKRTVGGLQVVLACRLFNRE